MQYIFAVKNRSMAAWMTRPETRGPATRKPAMRIPARKKPARSKDKSPAASSSPAKEQQQPSLEEILYVFQETAEKKLDKKFQEFMEDIRNSQV